MSRFSKSPSAFPVLFASSSRFFIYPSSTLLQAFFGLLMMRLGKCLRPRLKEEVASLLGPQARSRDLSNWRRGEWMEALRWCKSSFSPNATFQFSFWSRMRSIASSLAALKDRDIPFHTRLVRLHQYFSLKGRSSRNLTASLNTPRNSWFGVPRTPSEPCWEAFLSRFK